MSRVLGFSLWNFLKLLKIVQSNYHYILRIKQLNYKLYQTHTALSDSFLKYMLENSTETTLICCTHTTQTFKGIKFIEGTQKMVNRWLRSALTGRGRREKTWKCVEFCCDLNKDMNTPLCKEMQSVIVIWVSVS